MKKFILSLAAVAAAALSVNAQVEYHHAAGAHLLTSLTKGGGGLGISYEARLNVVKLGDNALSVSAYPGFGFDANFNSRSGGSASFSYEVPVLACFNLGKDATKDNESDFGFFAGAGYHLYGFGSNYGAVSGSGAIGMLGARFILIGRPLEVNLSYTTGDNVVGGRLLYVFGGG